MHMGESRRPARAAPCNPQRTIYGGIMKILIVEDEFVSRKKLERAIQSLASGEAGLSKHLSDDGYEIEFAGNGADALEMALSGNPPDLILLDIVMPKMDGYEVCRRLKADDRTRHIPVIFITASAEERDEAKGFALGAVDYIRKPFGMSIVKARVRTHLELKRHRDQMSRKNIRLNEMLKEVEETNNKLTESIRYAKKIQDSLLQNRENISSYLPNSFFIWMPRDIVSGDIFFTDRFEEGFVFAVIDCTGHGVPGAFMTMIASSGLKRIIKDEGCHNPGEILKQLNFIIKTLLHQDSKHALSDDGLDAALCFVGNPLSPETDDRVLTYAGARIPLFCVYEDEVTVIKGDRQSIGYKKSDLNFDFTNHRIPVQKGMTFYMSTDGFIDQLGGERNRRFGTARFKELLKQISGKPFETQRDILLEAFTAWQTQGNREILDDVTVVGFGF
jgi:DNA-binding response OmpR family regulator